MHFNQIQLLCTLKKLLSFSNKNIKRFIKFKEFVKKKGGRETERGRLENEVVKYLPEIQWLHLSGRCDKQWKRRQIRSLQEEPKERRFPWNSWHCLQILMEINAYIATNKAPNCLRLPSMPGSPISPQLHPQINAN